MRVTATRTLRPPRRRSGLGGVGLILAGALSVHSGSAVAASLFPRAGVWAVVAMRLALGAVVLLAVCRPAIRGRSRADRPAPPVASCG